MTGLGSSMGDDVGDSSGKGDGSEYIELASDRTWPRTGDSLSLCFGVSVGKAASKSGSKEMCASFDVGGITRARLERLLFGKLIKSCSTAFIVLLSDLKVSLSSIAGSMVSGISSGIVVAYTGIL